MPFPLVPLVLAAGVAGLVLRARRGELELERVPFESDTSPGFQRADFQSREHARIPRVPPAPLDAKAIAKRLGIPPLSVPKLVGVDGLALAATWPDFGFPLPPAVDNGTRPIAGGGTLDQRALAAFQRGECPIRWVPLRVTAPNEPELTVFVADDDLCLGDTTRARLTISRLGAQAFCKAYDWVLPTPRICCALYGAALVQLPMRAWNKGPWRTPPPVPASTVDNPGFSRALWLNRDTWIESQRAGRLGLVANAGKVLCVAPGLAANKLGIYGWFSNLPPAAPGSKTGPWSVADAAAAAPARSTFQTGPSVHDPWFLDYSQMFRPVQRYALLDGVKTDLQQLYADPRLSKLVGSSVSLAPY